MPNPASLSGQRLGSYDVGPLIGVGGMGEVYRARDSKLNRDVAIKVLLPAVAADIERLARFRREAQTLASLNHPGIAQIHGIEDSASGPFLVMELVDGPTLADRIAAGAIPVDEAITIARQIADALEAAHERGIIHRDLKPANIKVRDDGTVKILDFGLAKALDPQSGIGAAGSMANSPTITSPATQAGLILGTAAYMSPEQAKGRVVDKRTDVWAFGCVVYEMLTGRRAFDGEDVTDTIAAVVRGEPDWNALPKDTPPQIRLLLKRCLDKDRRARIGDIGVARFLLNEHLDQGGPSNAQVSAVRSRSMKFGLGTVTGLVVGAAAALGVGWALRQPPREWSARFMLTPPATQSLAIQGNDRDVALAPDGSFVVYRSVRPGAPPQLSVRAVNELEPRTIQGTAPPRSPVVSPDGRWVAFAAGGELRKVPIAGGPPTTICTLAGALRGLSWGDDDHIVFATSQVGPLQRVSADGGEPQPLSKPREGINHVQPFVLPGARAVLFTATTGSIFNGTIEVVDLASGTQKTVINGGFEPAYLESGHLVYAVTSPGDTTNLSGNGSLRAVRFDAGRLEVIGDSVSVLDGVAVMATGAANYAVAKSGHLIYVPASVVDVQSARRAIVWVDRKGRETPIAAPARAYEIARISPDGAKVALDVRDQANDIWIWDLERHTLVSLNRDPAQDMSPLWLPDGRRILWASTRAGTTPNLYWRSADGTGAVDRLTTHPQNQFPTSVTPDGSTVIFFGANAAQSLDIFRLDLRSEDRKPVPLITGSAVDLGGELSPDARWLAYHSNESGEFQVFVRPYPNVEESRVQISTAGGTRPAWSRRGDELFYLDQNGLLNSVRIKVEGGKLSAGVPVRLLSTAYRPGSSRLGLDLRAYDVAPDASRFLMIKDLDDTQTPQLPGMVLVLNWVAEVSARLPVR